MTYHCSYEPNFGGICGKPSSKFFIYWGIYWGNTFPFCERHYSDVATYHNGEEVTEDEYLASLVVDA